MTYRQNASCRHASCCHVNSSTRLAQDQSYTGIRTTHNILLTRTRNVKFILETKHNERKLRRPETCPKRSASPRDRRERIAPKASIFSYLNFIVILIGSQRRTTKWTFGAKWPQNMNIRLAHVLAKIAIWSDQCSRPSKNETNLMREQQKGRRSY